MSGQMRVLCVCTHNRTRSVIAGALLERYLCRAGIDALVASAGTQADGRPVMERAAKLLNDRGIDVTIHRSRRLEDDLVAAAGLIVTAEHPHVVSIAGRWPEAFRRTFTMPELVERGGAVGPRAGRPLDDWLGAIGAGRPTPIEYLDLDVTDDIPDPTGGRPKDWEASFARIDELTIKLARLLT